MSPRTKHYLIIGGIAAGALVVVMVVSRRASSASSGTSSGVLAAGTTGAASTGVTTSSLATFEQSVATALSGIQTQMASGFTQLASLGGPGAAGNPTNPATSSGSGGSGGSASSGSAGSSGSSTTVTTPTTTPAPKTTTTKKLTWNNQGYSWVSNYATAQADLAAGETLYFNAAGPKSGTVVPVKYRKGMKLPKGTTLEVKN